jgi:hypothetical protein
MKTKSTIATLKAYLPIAAVFGLLLIPKTGLAASISCGQTITGATTSAGESDAYSYIGSAGQVVSIGFYWGNNSGNLSGTVDIYNPSGQWMTNVPASCPGGTVNFTLPSSGAYTILVHASGYNVTANYSLSLQSVNNGGCSSQTITCGQTLASSTGTNSEMDAYSYTGSAGQVVSIGFWWGNNNGNLSGTVDIYNPSGQWVTKVPASCPGGTVNFTLPSSGAYTILVHATGYNVTASYNLSLQTVNNGGCNGITIPCGQTINGQISLKSQMNGYEMVANAGEHILLSNSGFSGMVVDIYDPTGSNVASMGASTSVNITLAATGIYTVVVHAGNYTGTGSYSLDLTVFGGCASLPTVSVTPTNLAAISGSPATITAAASGPTPLYYQWRFGTSPISGATNTTYSIAQMHTNNVGAYVVVVSNPGGAVTSAPPALLSITGPHVAVIKSGTNNIISWPTNYAAGFTLETTTNLSLGNWVPVTNPFTIVGTNVVFTNIISGKSAFFRLVQ